MFYLEVRLKAGIIIAAVLAVVAAGCIAAFIIMRNVPIEAPAAEIRVDGEVVRVLPMDQDAEYTVETKYGKNTVQVSGGEVRITSADCPDKVCVKTGGISGGVVPIICLPHRLEVRVIDSAQAEFDAGTF